MSNRTLPPVTMKARPVRQETLVRMAPLQPETRLPLVVQPAVSDLDLLEWSRSRRDLLESLLRQHGALLFRGFVVPDVPAFEAFVTAISGDPLEYMEQTSPRHKVHGNLYTSTEYPPDHRIFFHNENSYAASWPLKILFYCVTPAEQGGETPLADVRRVLARISPATRDRFARDGWLLVRNLGTGYGLSWQTVFQTDNREDVNRYCETRGIEYEWLSAERLRMRERRPALQTHPVTGEPLWFNHATFFHVSTLAPEIRAGLEREFAQEDLPFNTYYGDGAPIEPAVLDELRAAYDAEGVMFPWQRHDVLMVDNMLVAHGRSSFRGPRKIVVGMTDLHSSGRGE